MNAPTPTESIEANLSSIEVSAGHPNEYMERISCVLENLTLRLKPFGMRYQGTPDGSPGLTLKIQTCINPATSEIQVCWIDHKSDARHFKATKATVITIIKGIIEEASATQAGLRRGPAITPKIAMCEKPALKPSGNKTKVGETLTLF